jgi:hypothetical protein
MPISLADLSSLVSEGKLRHHVDAEEGVIRVVLVTRGYRNPRGEHLAIVTIRPADEGRSYRATIERAFPLADDAAAACLAACGVAATIPLVAVEHDCVAGCLRLVAEMPVEDGEVTSAQVGALVDRLVEGAEAIAVPLAIPRRQAA